MKKIIVIVLILITLTGCNKLMNTPTKKVEAMLNNYVTLNKDVLDDLDNTLLSETIMTSEQKEHYKKILKRQYQNMSYEIKNETIDGKTAVVEVEIKVYDYYKVNQKSENYFNNNQSEFKMEDGTIDITKYNEYKLNALDKANDRVTYTLNLTLSQDNGNFVLDDLTDTEISKIHGLYAY